MKRVEANAAAVRVEQRIRNKVIEIHQVRESQDQPGAQPGPAPAQPSDEPGHAEMEQSVENGPEHGLPSRVRVNGQHGLRLLRSIQPSIRPVT